MMYARRCGFDASLTGFGELKLDALLAEKTEGRTNPDDVPPPPEHPVSQPGDLWLLGASTLLLCLRCRLAPCLGDHLFGHRLGDVLARCSAVDRLLGGANWRGRTGEKLQCAEVDRQIGSAYPRHRV